MKSTNEITLVIYSRLQDINYNSVIENKSSINRRNNWYWWVHGQDIQPWSGRPSFPGYPLHPKESLGMRLINSVWLIRRYSCTLPLSRWSLKMQHLNKHNKHLSKHLNKHVNSLSTTCQQHVNEHLNNMSTNISTNMSTTCQRTHGGNDECGMPGKSLWYKCDRAGGCGITGYHVLVVFPPWLRVRLQEYIPALLLRYSAKTEHMSPTTGETLYTAQWISVIEIQGDRCQQWKPTTWIAIILSAKKSCLTTIENSPIFTLAPKVLSPTRLQQTICILQ